MAPVTLVLVHGAWCGPWIFWKLGPALDDVGVPWIAADLPSCSGGDPALGPVQDVAHVRGLIDAVGGPVVLVGKSYGGAIITSAAVDRPSVQHLVYLAALMPTVGEPFNRTVTEAMQPEFLGGISMQEDGRLLMDLEVGARCAFSNADEADRDVWRRHASPLALGTEPTVAWDEVAWTSVPSTYVVCEEDRAIRPDVQRTWAQQATYSVVRPFDHSPGVSAPDEVADLLAAIATTGTPT